MPSLRLLYCDSAGIRRCRVVVVQHGAAPPTSPGPWQQQQQQGQSGGQQAPSSPGPLDATPSMLLAAGAGAVPPPGRLPLTSSGSLKTVGEDRVLSPEATDEQQQQQQQRPVDANRSDSGSSDGSRPQLRNSPSMLLAAEVGAVAAPPEGTSFALHSESSREASPEHARGAGRDACELQRQAQLAAASAAAASAVGGGGQAGGASGLQLSPSMVWAAGAGVLPAGAQAAAAGRPASPPSSAPCSPPPQQSQLQQQPSGPLSRSGSGGPRSVTPPLPRRPSGSRLKAMSAFALSPLASSAAAAALSAAVEHSVGLTKACMAHPCFGDIVADGSGLCPVGEVLLVPDLAAAVAVPWCPGSSMAPADMVEKDLSQPWSCCPRAALKRALTRLEARHGLTAMVGFELEFLLLKPTDPKSLSPGARVLVSGGQAWVPFDDSVYDQTASIDAAMPVMSDIVSTLEALGIGALQFHAESAPGQFEVALTHFPALEAADKLVFAREAVASVARRHGLAASFLPKPLAGAAGSGCHMHFSLLRGGSNIMAAAAGEAAAEGSQWANLPPGCHILSATANSFLAGVISHLPGLLPLTLPSVNSYERLKPCCWSGAYLCWGYENREAPLRVCCPRGGPSCTNAEYKAFDGSTNPYIGMAAVLAAGMQGLEEGARLAAPLQVDPGAPCNAALARALHQLPAAMSGALQALEDDDKLQAMLREVLGAELMTAYLAVRRCEEAEQPGVGDLLLRY